MHQNSLRIKLFLCLFVLISAFFSAGPVAAADLRCCVQKSKVQIFGGQQTSQKGRTLQERMQAVRQGSFTDVCDLGAIGCRLLSTGPCDTNVQDEGTLKPDGWSIFAGTGNDESQIASADGTRCNLKSIALSNDMYKRVSSWEEVSCGSYQKACTAAMSGQTNCSLNDKNQSACIGSSNCFYAPTDQRCLSKYDPTVCPSLHETVCGKPEGAPAITCVWNTQSHKCLSRVESELSGRSQAYEGGIIPVCAYQGNCRDLNDLLLVGIRLAQWSFRFIGGFAFIMFIYGGIMITVSMGNSERVGKGTQIITAAVVGLFISFGAYMLVNFILDALNVSSMYRGI